MVDDTATDNQPAASAGVPRRILIRGVNWLGDAVMVTPALRRLREALPHAHITLLTQEKLADLWQQHPSINDVVTFASGDGPWSVARRLRPQSFDTALILPNSPRAALEAWLARVPQRIGYARLWRNWFLTQAVPSRLGQVKMRKRSVGEIRRLTSEAGRSRAIDNRHVAPNKDSVHQIHEYLHLVAALGAKPAPLPPALHVNADEVKIIARRFGLGVDPHAGQPVFGLNPGAAYGPAKRWPLDRFIAVAREIRRRSNCAWLLFGGPADLSVADAIHSALTHISPSEPDSSPQSNLAGKTTLRELMGLLKVCRVLLTNDTGPMHLAAALGTPVVVPFGSTLPALTGPGLPGDTRHHVLTSDASCAPCFRRTCPIDFRCMTSIGVERVVEAVLEAAATP